MMDWTFLKTSLWNETSVCHFVLNCFDLQPRRNTRLWLNIQKDFQFLLPLLDESHQKNAFSSNAFLKLLKTKSSQTRFSL